MASPRLETAEFWELPGFTAERREAVRDVWGAFWSSRLLIWAAGMAAVLAFGWSEHNATRLDPLYLTLPFGDAFSNLLVAPAARFDSAWYLTIAQHGYDATGRPAFFPLLPALLRMLGTDVGAQVLAGIAISSVCGIGGLYLLHRLVSLDFDVGLAKSVVWLAAWFPGALVLSAVYTESLFLLLSIGAIYAARLGKWPIAGILGGAAAASRSGGVLLIVPLLILYLYGPRADAPAAAAKSLLRPRYPLRPSLLWVLVGVPAGLVAYMAYLGMNLGDPSAVFTAQDQWGRTFVPLGGLVTGAWAGITGAWDLLVPGVTRQLDGPTLVSPELLSLRDVFMLGFLVLGLWLVYECAKRLNLAYTAYAVCGLALPVSVPAHGYPLMSLPRFMFVLFPLWIALALWTAERGRYRRVLVVFGVLLAASGGLFVEWVLAP
jgi:Mannosyltransferase (PIG-V)